jgi:hypothetical protein
MVEPQLHRISYPVLVVAGTVDRLLPSYEEAQRLKRELAKCSVHYASEDPSSLPLPHPTCMQASIHATSPPVPTLPVPFMC